MTVNNYHMLSNHSMVKQQVQRYLKDYNEATNKNILQSWQSNAVTVSKASLPDCHGSFHATLASIIFKIL